MDIDLDMLFGFNTNPSSNANNNNNNNNANNNNNTANSTEPQHSSTTTATTVQLPLSSQISNENKAPTNILPIIQQQTSSPQQQQQQQQPIQLTNVTLTNETLQQLQQNRSSIVVLTPIGGVGAAPGNLQYGQVIGASSATMNLTSVTLTPVKEQEFCKIQLITLTDKTGAELKTSYRVVKSVPVENANTKKDNFRVKGSNTVYNCLICPYKTPKIKSMKEHLVNHRAYPDSSKCRYCEYYSPYALTLQQHEVLHREYTPQSTDEEDKNTTGQESTTPVKLHSVTLDKVVVTSKEKKNVCDMCPYRTVKKRDLLLHQLNHTFRENYLKCRYCNYYLLNTKGKWHRFRSCLVKSFRTKLISNASKKSFSKLKLN